MKGIYKFFQSIGLFILKFWVTLAIRAYYRKIKVRGIENVPVNAPIIFAPNHQYAFMDALAQKRRSEGLKGLSINWGAWSHAGAAVNGTATARAALKGIDHFSPHTGLKLLEELIQMELMKQVSRLPDTQREVVSLRIGAGLPRTRSGLLQVGIRMFSEKPPAKAVFHASHLITAAR